MRKVRLTKDQIEAVGKSIARRWDYIAKKNNTTVADMIFKSVIDESNVLN